jgi:hypothetical protein
MRVVLRLAAVVVLLSGCTRVLDIAGVEWKRANTSLQQETLDEVECVRETEGAGDLVDTVVGGLADLVVVALEERRRGAAYDRCMVAKGYAPVESGQR